MHKLSKVTLLISTAIASQAFAADLNGLDVNLYGKMGLASQLDADSIDAPELDSRMNENFKGFSDTKAGVKLGYKINEDFSAHADVKSDFEGKDLKLRIEELYVKGQFQKFDVKAGRLRTPLYMNSTIQDDDFALNTYRGVRGFSTQDSPLENIDGVSVGFNDTFSLGSVEVRGLVGQAKDRTIAYWNGSETENYESNAEKTWALQSSLVSEIGKVRVSYLESEIEDKDFNSFALGFSANKNELFLETELAFEEYDNNDIVKGYATVGLHKGLYTPSLTYSQQDFDNSNVNDTKALELGLSYDFNKNIKLKAAYEFVDVENHDKDNVVSLGVAFKY